VRFREGSYVGSFDNNRKHDREMVADSLDGDWLVGGVTKSGPSGPSTPLTIVTSSARAAAAVSIRPTAMQMSPRILILDPFGVTEAWRHDRAMHQRYGTTTTTIVAAFASRAATYWPHTATRLS
jgi:hypothetical protein